MQNELGKRIEIIRLNLGMNKTEFGEIFSTNGSLVNKWENHNIKPSTDRLKKIAEMGKMTVDELIYGVPVWERFDEEYNSEGNLSSEVKEYEVFEKVYDADIGKMMQFIIEQLNSDNPNLTFNGEELEDDVKKMLAESLVSTYKMFSKLVK